MPVNSNVIKLKYGLQNNYDVLTPKDLDTIYFTTDSQRLFVGETEFTRPIQVGSVLPSGYQPPYSLFFNTADNQLYYTNGSKWDKCSNLYVHPISGVSEGSFGESADNQLNFGDLFKNVQFTVDKNGHITAATERTLTLPQETQLSKGTDSDKTSTISSTRTFKAVTGFEVSDHDITAEVTTFTLPEDSDTTYEFGPGEENGTISVKPKNGTQTDVKVTGLGSAAFKDLTNVVDDSDKLVSSSAVNSAINSAIASVVKFDVQIIDDLPESGVKGVIYLKHHVHGENDIYDEYIWNDKADPAKFEKIGNTDVDLSAYLKSSDAENKFISKVSGKAGQVVKLLDDGSIDGTGFTLGKSVPSDAEFTDHKVDQNAVITDSGEYPVMLGQGTDTNKVTGSINKAAGFTYNPSTKSLSVETINGTASKAISDDDGNKISETYATKAEMQNSALTWGTF